MDILMQAACWACGTCLMATLPTLRKSQHAGDQAKPRVSIIIPARNEELNLPVLLASIRRQTVLPDEVIVADDSSSDDTACVARQAICTVVTVPALPQGWQGKSWACWNGALQASGDVLVFLDADTSLADDALEILTRHFMPSQSPLSVQPHHAIVKPYENLSLFFNIVEMMGSGIGLPWKATHESPLFFGPCQMMTKADYFACGGHSAGSHAVLDDVQLGRNLAAKGLARRNFIGKGVVSFRMYPDGVASIVEGWSKNFASGSVSTSLLTLMLATLWVAGVGASLMAFASAAGQPLWPMLAMYAAYGVQIGWMATKVGRFWWLTAAFYPVAYLFFLSVFIWSLFLTFVIGRVRWKGRTLDIRRRHRR